MTATTDPMYFAVFDHLAHKPPMTYSERLDEYRAEAQLADELGFDYYFTTEHHFSGDFSLSPSQPVSLTLLAACTERIRFGPMISILPISDPLRVVEEFLILDHMSKGRLDIGLGRGITTHEHLTYNVQYDDSAAMFAEGLEFVVKALTTDERFSWVGRHYHYNDVDLPWSPYQKPHPPIWVPTSTPATARSMGERGFGMGGFGLLGPNVYRPVFDAYNEGWAESGRPEADKKLSWMAPTVVADTDEKARELAYAAFAHQVTMYELEGNNSLRMAPSQALRAKSIASLGRLAAMRNNLEQAEADGKFICGTPETVAAKIQGLRDDLAVNTYIGEFNMGLMDWADCARSLELFAKEVMPAFETAESAAA